ncbi:hypothetical protein [Acetobacterium wieringae]|uniref:hypothetical protein n=1 Tax=Acetobacterium wieringae TaxID=52694 RepID=UPI002B20AC9E|nr:hypothetical protein [Acetobacterium wieringae]MEA4805055.1 hypothetical protein [Acetobacterium wieringae]
MSLNNAFEISNKEFITVAAIGKTTINRHTGKVIEKKIVRDVDMTLEDLTLPLLMISKNEVLKDISEKMMQRMFDRG